MVYKFKNHMEFGEMATFSDDRMRIQKYLNRLK